jgi:cephalosporin-C deacetylase-like acetyl esterase/lysophospholipase L1-like esterase
MLRLALAGLLMGTATPFAPECRAEERPQSARWEKEIAAFEQKELSSPPPKNAILFVGSSSIRLWDLGKSFPGLDVINRGFGGSQLADSVYYAPRIVLKYAPRMVILYAGDNDIAAGKKPEQVAEDFRTFVKIVHKDLPTTRIVFLSIKPSILRWKLFEKMSTANRLIEAMCKQDERLLYVDVGTPLLGKDGKPRPELFRKDGLHLNDKGYEVWASVLRPIISSPLPGDLHAREQLSVLQAEDVAPGKMLYSYLLSQAQKHLEARRTAVTALRTPADIQKRQRELKEWFFQALGGLPPRTPLNAQVVGKQQRDGYRIEKVIYESRPRHHVTANLYLPDGPPPFPGVLIPIGHSENGKAAETAQRAAILLARHGLAALAYDPIGQGERRQLLDRQGKPALSSCTTEHTLVGIGALLVGKNTATYRVWDGIRSLDYLVSRPEIDARRLGCTGCSGGGTLTSYLMALDDRMLAAAPSCYLTSLERLFATIGPQDAEQNITGQVAFGLDHADYLTMRAPRPTLICAASHDFFDIQGTWGTFREAKRVYSLLGYGERVDLFESDTGHGFPRPQREAMLRWMQRWLLGKDGAAVEEDAPIAKEADLLCTQIGQVLVDLKDKSVFDLNAEQARQLADQRAQSLARRSREDLIKDVSRLIGVALPVPAAKLSELAVVPRDSYGIRKLAFATEPGITVPGLLFTRGTEKRGPLVLYLQPQGKAADAGPGGPLEKLVQSSGQSVLALDLRGLGETAAAVPAGNRPNYLGADVKEAFLALHLNRPLLGQRVKDLLAVVEALAAENPEGFEVIAYGMAGPIALHAAALDQRIKRATLERSLVSWLNVVDTPLSRNQLANVVPGVLRVYDLPELAASLAPRPLAIRQSIDAEGKRLAQAALETVYACARSAYSRRGADQALVLVAQPPQSVP